MEQHLGIAQTVIIEYPIVLAMLYFILFVGGALLAARSFSKHQVA